MERVNYKLAGLILAYPMSYFLMRNIYNDVINPVLQTVIFLLLTIGFVVWNEVVLRGRGKKTNKEGYFWYGILILVAATVNIAPINPVSVLGWYLCVIYSSVVAGGAALEGMTGKHFAYDLAEGLASPFKGLNNFVDDVRDVVKNGRDGKKPIEKKSVFFAIVACGIMFVIFVAAFITLSVLDKTFGRIGDKVFDWIFSLEILNNPNAIISAFLALPLTFFTYALVSRTANAKASELAFIKETIEKRALSRQNVSHIVINVFVAFFIIMYFVFFGIHANTILCIFRGAAPAGMLISSYARSGFFSLVFIMVLNALVYFVALRYQVRNGEVFSKSTRGLMTVLMGQTLVFSLLSAGRLVLYFASYGFTPMRMIAIWGTLVMTAATVFIIAGVNSSSLLKANAVNIRRWVFFTTISYVVMCLVNGICLLVF